MKNKSKKQELKSAIAQLISAEQLVSLVNLKAKIERNENRQNRRENKKLHRNVD